MTTFAIRALIAASLIGLGGHIASASDPGQVVIEQDSGLDRAEDRLREALRDYERAREKANARETVDDHTDGLAGGLDGKLADGLFGGGLFGDGEFGKGIDGERVRRLIDDPEGLREAARDAQSALEDARIFETLADMLIELSEDVEFVETDDSFALNYRGGELAKVETDGDSGVKVRAGGRTLTLQVE